MTQRDRAEKWIRRSRNELREVKVCHLHDRYGRNLIEEKRVHSRAQRRLGRALAVEPDPMDEIHPAEEELWDCDAGNCRLCGSEQDDEDTYRERVDGLSSEDH